MQTETETEAFCKRKPHYKRRQSYFLLESSTHTHYSEVLVLKHESRILGQWSNPVSGSRKSANPISSSQSNLLHHGETT